MISIEDCKKFHENFVFKKFFRDKTHEHYIHNDIDIWILIKIKEHNFMPSYFIFNGDNKLILLTSSPFEAERFINNRVRLEKVKKIMT